MILISLLYCFLFAMLPAVLVFAFISKRFKSATKPLVMLLCLCIFALIPGFAVTGLFSMYGSGDDMYFYTQGANILRGIEGSGMVLLATMPLWLIYLSIELHRSRLAAG